MFHLHIYLHKKLPFLLFTILRNKEVKDYEKYQINYKGLTLYELPKCKVCRDPKKARFSLLTD